MEVVINNRKYILNVDLAQDSGALKKVEYEPGDIFYRSGCFLILIRAVWGSLQNDKVYSFIGLAGRAESYSNHKELLAKEEVEAHINGKGYIKVGNINETIHNVFEKLHSQVS